MKNIRIECGVSRATQKDAIAMNVQGAAKNVKLRIDHITRTMLGNVPDLLLDLLEIAAYVYCADQRVGRGSDRLKDFGSMWRRQLHFSIPVRRFKVWQNPDVVDALSSTLGFLSDDSYEFEFLEAKLPSLPRDAYFHDLIDASMEHDEIALFSGGIDSLAGAIDDIILRQKTVTLVGHHSSTKVRSIQSKLVEELKRRGYGRHFSFIPVEVTNEGVPAREHTQRTRSFLFACLAMVIAEMSRRDRFTFYENGVVSINLPISGDVTGGRATRTTHPKVIRGLEALFSTLLERQFEIRTPLQWLTKTEVTQIIQGADMADLLAMTSSCTRPRTWTATRKHCGRCSQCIDRRFAILAAGLEDFDPAENYAVDLLMSDRSTDDSLQMALSYVSFFRAIGSVQKERFLVDYPEVVSALDQFPEFTAKQAGDSLFDLFRRQSQSVEDVIAAALAKHASALYRGELPSGSLLAVCFNRGHVEPEVPSDYDAQVKAFVDRLATPVLEFAIDAGRNRVLFRGETYLDGANFRLVDALLENFRKAKSEDREVPFLGSAALAEVCRVEEQSMRQQLRRLRDALKPLATGLGIPLDQNTFIETQDRRGYRLNPNLREATVADIRKDHPPPTRP